MPKKEAGTKEPKEVSQKKEITPYMAAKKAYFAQSDPENKYANYVKEKWWKHSDARYHILSGMSEAEIKRRRY